MTARRWVRCGSGEALPDDLPHEDGSSVGVVPDLALAIVGFGAELVTPGRPDIRQAATFVAAVGPVPTDVQVTQLFADLSGVIGAVHRTAHPSAHHVGG